VLLILVGRSDDPVRGLGYVLYSGGKAPPVAHTRENDQERSTTPSPTREHKQETNISNSPP
jgi:hypothetical protein